ncbi:MAG TPA: hypothetical protein VK788_21935 [Terriglobales bacterium]|jgi:hypothetical protein|nr:hypothetical protein [Terriglobales bacterium]
MPKKVQIDFAPKTPEELAERLGVSKTRLAQLVTIVGERNSRKNGERSVHAGFRKSRTANSRSARRNNAKTAR